jgi:hypothetical protein
MLDFEMVVIFLSTVCGSSLSKSAFQTTRSAKPVPSWEGSNQHPPRAIGQYAIFRTRTKRVVGQLANNFPFLKIHAQLFGFNK